MDIPLSIILKEKGDTIYHVAPTDSITKAVEIMNKHRIGAVVVLDNKQLAGVFTERDILMKVITAGLDPNDTEVKQVMTAKVQTISINATTTQAMQIMNEKKFRHLPVLGEEQNLLGFISISDMIAWLVKDQEDTIKNLEGYISGEYR